MKAGIRKKLIECWQTMPHNYRLQIYGIITPRKHGEFSLVCYAVKETKRFGIQITEVNRAWSDRPYYQCKNIWKNMWGGTMVEFDERRNRPSLEYAWYRGKWGNKIRWSGEGNWFVPYIKYINLDALAETKYKYCAYAQYSGNLSLMEYCRLFDKHKEVELLTKNNLHHFIHEKFLDRMSADNGLRNFFRSHAGNVGQYDICDVERAYKNGWSLDEAKMANYARYSLTKAPKGIDRLELAKYLKANDIDVHDYYHYAETVAKAKEDILAFGNTFPRNFHQREMEMQRKIAVAQSKEDRVREAQLKLIAIRVNHLLEKMKQKLAWRVGEYAVVVPTTRREFVAEGNAMHNCIGGYFEACADGDRLCFFIRKNGRRLADVEADPKTGAIRQCRAKYNEKTDDATTDFATVFAKKLVKMLKKRKVA